MNDTIKKTLKAIFLMDYGLSPENEKTRITGFYLIVIIYGFLGFINLASYIYNNPATTISDPIACSYGYQVIDCLVLLAVFHVSTISSIVLNRIFAREVVRP